jgi:hypothetical protein
LRSKWTLALSLMMVLGVLSSAMALQGLNANAASYELLVSTSSVRTDAAALEGRQVSGNVYVFTSPDTSDITRVQFYLDDPTRTASPIQTETGAPYDFAGGSASEANAFDTTGLPDGAHTITGVITHSGGASIIHASFIVANDGSTPPDTTPTPEPTPTEDPTTATATGNRVALVNSYIVAGKSPGYNDFKYRPRQFNQGFVAPSHKGDKTLNNPGSYKGWDVLITRNFGGARVSNINPWVTVRLNRAAQVAIVWQDKDAPPRWLASWQKAGTVTIGGTSKTVYKKSFTAGDFSLGSVWDTPSEGSYGRETYLVLFAESSGTPTANPSVPAGQVVPVANQTCPTWVHDQYVATAPDGNRYPTWHPQIDPVYWCYFRHDHGTNPKTFGDGSVQPTFGYAGGHHDMDGADGLHEAHAGFKVFVGDFNGSTEFLATVHMGSASLVRYCARFHEVSLAIWDGSQVVANVSFVGDFGRAVVNRLLAGQTQHVAFTPAACPNQGKITGSIGERHLPSAHAGSIGYEGWRVDLRNLDLLGFAGETMTFWTQDGMIIANDVTASQPVTMASRNDADHQIQDIHNLRFVSPARTGTFYTNPYGTALVSPSTAHAVEQYIAPGVALDFAGVAKCRDLAGWGRQLTCHVGNPADGNEEREDSLGPEFIGTVAYLK